MNLRYYLGIFLWMLRKSTRSFHYDNQCPARYSNEISTECTLLPYTCRLSQTACQINTENCMLPRPRRCLLFHADVKPGSLMPLCNLISFQGEGFSLGVHKLFRLTSSLVPQAYSQCLLPYIVKSVIQNGGLHSPVRKT